jgi:hypothetical protein
MYLEDRENGPKDNYEVKYKKKMNTNLRDKMTSDHVIAIKISQLLDM